MPFRLHLGAEHAAIVPELEARGFVRAEPAPGMVLRSINDDPTRCDGLTIRKVTDTSGLAHFQNVAFESFGYPVELAPLALTEDLMALPHAAMFVGYARDEPACCSMVISTGDIAGIYWVGSLGRFRQRGFGAAVTAHAIRAGAVGGCRLASLQASKMGEPVYRRLGDRGANQNAPSAKPNTRRSEARSIGSA